MNKSRVTDRDREISRRVWMRRRFVGMSQAELAAGLGVAYQQIHKYENALNRIPASRLAQIAETLDTPISYFYEPAPRQKAA